MQKKNLPNMQDRLPYTFCFSVSQLSSEFQANILHTKEFHKIRKKCTSSVNRHPKFRKTGVIEQFYL